MLYFLHTKDQLMKKINIIFMMFIFLPLSAYSQVDWFPIGAEWHYEAGNAFALNPVHKFHFIVEKDTIVEGKSCRLISGGNTENVVYEEGGCVYYYFNDKFRKIYDFSVKAGDIVDIEFKTLIASHGEFDTTLVVPCHVEKIESKFVGGKELKEIHTTYSIDVEFSPDEWINQTGEFVYLEKIGCEHPGLIGGEFIPHIGTMTQVPEYYYTLKSYNDIYIDHVSNMPLYNPICIIKTYPNPAKDHLTIYSESEDIQTAVSILIYDAGGKIVLSHKDIIPCELNLEGLISGIYFIRILKGTKCLMSNKLIVK